MEKNTVSPRWARRNGSNGYLVALCLPTVCHASTCGPAVSPSDVAMGPPPKAPTLPPQTHPRFA